MELKLPSGAGPEIIFCTCALSSAGIYEAPSKTIISAFGYKAYNPLEKITGKYCGNVKVVGCAIKAGNALTAIREGYEAALAL